ncbi:Protein deglycase [Spironucleus salmonicida]|uniref:4-methyl-5-thiazole monophosphate biosynthesis enzyme n=1 Tax=Spironucleus salmonicida TaxID=348837 RepID=V6LIR7_9EUKA|nr:Protein deglycase [Spironucleus salmonicida]|eukprot:EST44452.1 4-methyl-5-thiazole monophosphate biosynthesis enzyme [Spironucleus salmonicida]
MKILIFAYQQADDIELICSADFLRQNGYIVVIYAQTTPITLSHGTVLIPDTTFIPPICDAILLPGGQGFKQLIKNSVAKQLFQQYHLQSKYIFTISSASALVQWKIWHQIPVCTYPGLEVQGAVYQNQQVVVGGKYICGRGIGGIIEFLEQIHKKFTKSNQF